MLDINTKPCIKTRRKNRRSRTSPRPYIRLTLTSNVDSINNIASSSTSTKIQTLCAFEDLFVSERDAMRVSYFELQIDDSPPTKQKNSGIELSVREALHEMNVNETQLMDIIELMQQAGYSIHVPNNNELKSVDDLCKKLEQKDEIKSKQEMNSISYRLKEPVFNSTFERIADRGQMTRLWIRSKCTNGQILIDRHQVVSFGFGDELLIEFCDGVSELEKRKADTSTFNNIHTHCLSTTKACKSINSFVYYSFYLVVASSVLRASNPSLNDLLFVVVVLSMLMLVMQNCQNRKAVM